EPPDARDVRSDADRRLPGRRAPGVRRADGRAARGGPGPAAGRLGRPAARRRHLVDLVDEGPVRPGPESGALRGRPSHLEWHGGVSRRGPRGLHRPRDEILRVDQRCAVLRPGQRRPGRRRPCRPDRRGRAHPGRAAPRGGGLPASVRLRVRGPGRAFEARPRVVASAAMRLAVALLVLALPSVASARPFAERATTLASYCSPSGDVCYGLIRRNGVVGAELTTAAHYFNRYTLCVRPPGSG